MIFIIDDNDANLSMAASALEDEYRVLTMPSAKKMFSVLEKRKADLILLDIEMDEMNGFEAIAVLKESPQWSDIPVVFLTGWNDDKIKASALNSGAIDIIFKPIVPSVLRDSVKKYLGEL